MALVTMGKYKGQPWSALLADTNYFNFISSHPGMRQNILSTMPSNLSIIHMQTPGDKPHPTPRHNAMQNTFLSAEFRLNFVTQILHKSQYGLVDPYCHSYAFEALDGTDVVLTAEEKTASSYSWLTPNRVKIYIEIKPSLADEYPTVLRTIKGRKKSTPGGIWVLLIEEFAAESITRKDATRLFRNENILLACLPASPVAVQTRAPLVVAPIVAPPVHIQAKITSALSIPMPPLIPIKQFAAPISLLVPHKRTAPPVEAVVATHPQPPKRLKTDVATVPAKSSAFHCENCQTELRFKHDECSTCYPLECTRCTKSADLCWKHGDYDDPLCLACYFADVYDGKQSVTLYAQ
jgi:hypothetical protein